MTTPIDVNAGFDATRAGQVRDILAYNAQAEAWNSMTSDQRQAQLAQDPAVMAEVARFEQRVADGKMVNLGDGRYRVNEPGSYDNGEVFYVQRAATGNRALLVLPESGLQEIDGKTALYSRYPEWHNLGTIIPAGLSSIPAVLRAAGLDFTVKQRPAGMFDETTGEFIPVPGQFVNYRDDMGTPFAVVGKVYTPIQPAQSMAFLQGLVDDESVIIESAGAMAGGARIFVTCLLPDDMVIDAEGVADHVQMHIAVIDRYDGNGKFLAIATPWRIRCGNTERFALEGAVARWGIRHTTTAPQRVAEAQRTLGLTRKYAERWAAEENQLAQTAVNLDQFDALIAEVWGERDKMDESKRTTTVADRRETELHQLFGQYSGELGHTGYAAERAVTDWLDHVAPRRVTGDKLAAARATAMLEGSDDDLKAKAHTRLMTLVNH